MTFRIRPALLLTLMLALFVSFSTSAFADGWIHTGDAVRTKSVGPFTAKVYSIKHEMKERPAAKTKQAIIEADVDKKFTWRMLRDVDSEKIRKALTEAFAMNGYNDGGKIGTFVGAFKGEVKEDSAVVITYNATNKTTTIWVASGGSATVAGNDFMQAVWKIWFGRIDQPSMGDQLMAKL